MIQYFHAFIIIIILLLLLLFGNVLFLCRFILQGLCMHVGGMVYVCGFV